MRWLSRLGKGACAAVQCHMHAGSCLVPSAMTTTDDILAFGVQVHAIVMGHAGIMQHDNVHASQAMQALRRVDGINGSRILCRIFLSS